MGRAPASTDPEYRQLGGVTLPLTPHHARTTAGDYNCETIPCKTTLNLQTEDYARHSMHTITSVSQRMHVFSLMLIQKDVKFV